MKDELLTKYTDESRFVQSVWNEIGMIRQKLADQASKRYEVEMEALRARKQTQLAQLARYQKRLEELNQVETQFNHLQQQVEA